MSDPSIDNRPAVEGQKAGCPACMERRCHSEEEWEKYHPKAGTGVEYRITK